MSIEEQHEYLCGILAKLVDVLTCDELMDLSSVLGIAVDDFYAPTPLEVIEWSKAA